MEKIQEYSLRFMPQAILIFVCLFSIIMFCLSDLISGIRKGRKIGVNYINSIHSFGLRRTTEKIGRYLNFMLTFIFIDILQMAILFAINLHYSKTFWIFPFICILGTIFIGFTEIRSIFEDEDKKVREKLKKDVKIIDEIVDYVIEKRNEINSTGSKSTHNDDENKQSYEDMFNENYK